MKINRRPSREVRIGRVTIGGKRPIAIQSMAKVKTEDHISVLAQIKRLEDCGCDIVRLAVKDKEDCLALKKIKSRSSLPLVADIHFDWRLAVSAIESGVDKIRLNPGNIYKKEEVRSVARAAKSHGIPIRVGLNSGSLPKRAGAKGSGVSTGMVKSALSYIRVLEKEGFGDIVVSLKASHILDTVEAYRKMAAACDYPLHLGVTATGGSCRGSIKSSIGVGALLMEGIGDTIRISLTDSPEEEVAVAGAILDSLGLRVSGPDIISCPTCGRCEVDLVGIVKELEGRIKREPALKDKTLSVAVMGCVVNGPGEAKEADLGVAFGRREGLLFRKGRPVRKIASSACVRELIKAIKGN